MQQYLLDTHTLIWFLSGDNELSRTARSTIEGVDVINFVSIASVWEDAIKVSLNKLELKTPFYQIYRQILENGFELLPVGFEDTCFRQSDQKCYALRPARCYGKRPVELSVATMSPGR